jgi:hypothetical protein
MHASQHQRTLAKAAVRALPHSAIERIAAKEGQPAEGMRRTLMRRAWYRPERVLRTASV